MKFFCLINPLNKRIKKKWRRIMRLTFILLVGCILTVSANSYSQNTRLDIKLKNGSILDLIEMVEKQSEFVFLYKDEDLNLQKKLTVNLKEATISQVLKEGFKEQNVAWDVYDRQIVLRKAGNPSAATVNSLQQRTVTGVISDQQGLPLPGVSVVVKGTTTGTVTDADGKFSLTIPAGADILQFSFVGMVTQEISIGDRTAFTVVMEEEITELAEIVAVGYGEMSRERVSTSISKIDENVMLNTITGTPGSLLQGTIPGLRVQQGTGQPGSVPTIILRGGASISSPQAPLVVVDGIVRHMNDVNTQDIKSIHVLRDAAATAVYGARANSGVILIETISGEVGRTEITYDYDVGLNIQRKDYEYANAEQYLYYQRLGVMRRRLTSAMANQNTPHPDGMDHQGFARPEYYDQRRIDDSNRHMFQNYINEGWQWMLDPVHGDEIYAYKDTIVFRDYTRSLIDEVFNMTARTQRHNLRFSGGDRRGTFSSNINYYREEGLIVDTYYERLAGKLSGSYNVLDNFEVDGNLNLSYAEQPTYIVANGLYRARIMWPTWNPWNEDGTPRAGPQTSESYGNPAFWKQIYDRRDNAIRSSFTLGAKWQILPDLRLQGKGNIYYVEGVNESFQKRIVGETGVVNDARPASASTNRHIQMQHNLNLDYIKSFGNHNISLLVAGEYLDFQSFYLSASGRGAATDDIPTLNASAEYTGINSERSGYRMISSINRLNYDYDGKYLFTSVLRVDGTSQLADNRWGTFPGFSAGWNMHREDFFLTSPLGGYFSYLKPRVSYGQNGNIAGIGRYETQGAYGFQTRYNQSASILNTAVINRGLLWERSVTFDAGIQFGLFKNKISGELTYFDRKNTDLLTNLALPNYTGFGSFRTNLGDYGNKGFEASADINILSSSSGWNWNLNVNASYVKSTILRLPENDQENNRQGGIQIYDPKQGKVVWAGGLQEGGRVGDIVAYKAIRVLRDWDDVWATVPDRIDEIIFGGVAAYGPAIYATIPQNERTGKYPIQPGDILWEDFDGNGIINTLDQFVIGNIYPNWTGGFSTSLAYKELSLYARFDFALGHTIYNHYLASLMGNQVGHMNFNTYVLDSWTEENKDAKYPVYSFGDYPMLNYKKGGLHYSTPDSHSSQMYEKGDYLALREITLTYTVPERLVSRIGIGAERIRANLTAENLHYFTAYSGWNPEQGGTDFGRYPIPINVVLGLQVSF